MNLFLFFHASQVLAALAYSRNPPGVRFVNPRQWVTYHMFEPASIWDIPLVKPRFACSFDMSPVNSGYDVAKELELHLGHFQHGGACETGFIPFDNGSLRPKAYIEFGEPTGKSMPSLSGISVSVVFNVGADVHPDSLRISLASVVDKFRDASEAVVVFNEPPLMKEQLMEVIKAQDKGSNVDVFAVETPASLGVESGSDLEWTGLHADEYCTGDFVMHMEPGDVFATDQVQYDNIFHFRRPVIPINRLATDKPGEGPNHATLRSHGQVAVCAWSPLLGRRVESSRSFPIPRCLPFFFDFLGACLSSLF